MISKNNSFITPFTNLSQLSQNDSEQQQNYFVIQCLKHQVNTLKGKVYITNHRKKLNKLVAINKRLESISFSSKIWSTIKVDEQAMITTQILRKLDKIEVKKINSEYYITSS